jgi:putative RNA 2'-phosphotransferase
MNKPTQKQTSQQEEISKTMSYALRHNPKQYGLELDEYGAVDINVFLEGLRKKEKKCKDLTIQEIEDIVKTCPKQRYILEDGKIRARGGHNKDLGFRVKKEVATPPDILYHGTNPDTVFTILKEGLKPMGRQNSNMSADIETAINVGRRKCKKHEEPVILVIDAKQVLKDNEGLKDEDKIEFYLEAVNTYSVIAMPAKYITKMTK